jgi:uncharacterized protein YbbC (DUF1343 family)
MKTDKQAPQMSRRAFGLSCAAAVAGWQLGHVLPAAAQGDMSSIRQALQEAVERSGSPGAVGYVGNLRQTLFHEAYGNRRTSPSRQPVEKDTIYDLASVTKVVATTTAVHLLREANQVNLKDPVSKFISRPGFDDFTVYHCLTHTTGMPWGAAMYRYVSTIDEMLDAIANLPRHSRPGQRWVYSDPGFILLGRIVEVVTKQRLDAFCHENIFKPQGMTTTFFNPPTELRDRCAATEKCAWRGRIIQGQVHDENCYAVGGVTGHAGLFSTGEDLGTFCRALMTGKILKPETLEEAARLTTTPVYPGQGLGWQLDPWESATRGHLPSRMAIGHSGWTGTSIWMDRDQHTFAILLGNSCHTSRNSRRNGTFRRTFHHAVDKRLYAGQCNAHSGLDRLIREDFDAVKGKRIGLLTNTAAVDQLGRSILEVLALGQNINLKRLFSPEHGLTVSAEAGARVSGQGGPVPVTSLYGERKEPTAEELADLDLFVIDLQEVGARYYTYKATMLACMKACAFARKPVLVLDRHNPVGGTVLEGPIATTTTSLVSCAPIPARYGMTLGELALYFKNDVLKSSSLPLDILKLDGWKPHLLHSACALPWVPPSPNIPTSETALAYVGTCLFEGTNLNEGRGTDAPFLQFGAPWLDAKAVLNELDRLDHTGCGLEEVRYTPRSIPGKAASPRFQDVECAGIRLHIEQPTLTRPFTTTLALIQAVRRVHPDRFSWEPIFDLLAGGPALRQALEGGKSALNIVVGAEPELEAFDKRRPKLYT